LSDRKKDKDRHKQHCDEKKKRKRRKTKSYLVALGNIEKDVSFCLPVFSSTHFPISVFILHT
jgi:hypothetical protein